MHDLVLACTAAHLCAVDSLDHDQVGEALFEVVHAARHAGVDPETALRATAMRFRDRFMALERLAGERGTDLRTAAPDVLARLWEEAQPAS